jgi:hypothetical protein
MSDRVTLRGGILIIGSLLWDESRQDWRDTRLDMASAEAVTAPIRYGRRSETRGSTYTMVFSRGCEAGRGTVVCCVRPISSVDDLASEAEHLWAAEQHAAVSRQISAGWGCVALLRNPDRDIPKTFLTGWANRVAQIQNYGNVPHTLDEGLLVSADGLLDIPWPQRLSDGSVVQLDFLLATATRPTLTGTPLSYPTVEAISEAWNADTRNRVEYFWNNYDNGIRTFQDEAIIRLLHPRTRGQA